MQQVVLIVVLVMMALLLVYSGKLGGYNATKETCVPWFKPPPSSNFGGKKPAGFIY